MPEPSYRDDADVSAILDPLNAEQRKAVTAASGYALVLAGAGSGKTRVLAHRIAWLCNIEGVPSYSIVAATFTNKAAREMRTRVEELLDLSTQGMWIGTFHGLCSGLLRRHWEEARVKRAFQVLDAQDQTRLIKRVTIGLNLDPEKWPVDKSRWFINSNKEKGTRSDAVQAEDFMSRELLRIYTAYEENCQRASLLDFTELLLRCVELLRDNPELLRRYHERFRAILVDEFQDTNALQYTWLRQLAGERIPIFAVGDDDQSIYGWRGARVENMHKLCTDLPQTETYRLERNYRSTSTILSAANALIENNQGRLGKNLWTDRGDGEPILFYAALNEREEAAFAANTIEAWTNRGRSRSEVAILYRSNAQSRVVEMELKSRGIAYRVYGGFRFFDRGIIQDAMAYFKLATNPEDDQSCARIINVPPRGIGERTLETMQATASADGVSLFEAGRRLVDKQGLPLRAERALKDFYAVLDDMKELRELTVHKAADLVVRSSGLLEYHRNRNTEESLSNVENLEEFVIAAEGIEKNLALENGLTPIDAFLSQVALASGEDNDESTEDRVQLMTLHAAKGLEFPLVMILGMEEELFPHAASMKDAKKLEEERRLCYVGITRAQEQLVMVSAQRRRRYGREEHNPPSRFVDEIPQPLIREIRPRPRMRLPPTPGKIRSLKSETGDSSQWQGIGIGDNVRHRKFGNGVVISREGAGSSARVQVRFEKAGTKWLVLLHANLTTG